MKVWRLPESGQDLPSSAGLTLGPGGGPVDVLQFHPTADGVLASGAGKRVTVWDVGQQQPLAGRKCGDVGAVGHWAARAELAWRWWQHTLVWVLNSVALSPEEPATASRSPCGKHTVTWGRETCFLEQKGVIWQHQAARVENQRAAWCRGELLLGNRASPALLPWVPRAGVGTSCFVLQSTDRVPSPSGGPDRAFLPQHWNLTGTSCRAWRGSETAASWAPPAR